MDNRAIGVFDSGLGGLTVVRALKEILPSENIIYFGDTGRVPYGTRSRDTIIKYALQDMRFLKSHGVKAIIVACHTASAVAYSDILSSAEVPVIGVVKPAVEVASKTTLKRRIGVLGTTATIKSGVFEKSLRELMPDVQVESIACPLFVPLVENGYFTKTSEIALLAAGEYLSALRDKGIDTLILGCTHYPIMREVIEQVVGGVNGVNIIDAGLQTAKAAAAMLRENDMLCESTEPGEIRFYVSDSTEDFAHNAEIYLKQRVEGRVEQIDIEKY